MALWGNKDSVYSDGTIAVNLGTNTVTGTVGVVTFTTAGIKTGDVITVGTGATYGYAVITGFTSTTISIANTANFVSGLTTVASGASYNISEDQSLQESKINQKYLKELLNLVGKEKFAQYIKARDKLNEENRKKYFCRS